MMEQEEQKESEAREYLNHLITNGAEEGDGEYTELHLPSWFNEEVAKRGQSYANTYRFVIFSGMMSGLIAVLAIPSILKVLVCTKQSGNAKMAYRRYVSTIFHVLNWHNYPLKPGSDSWKSIDIVRRKHCLSSHLSEKNNCGIITQKDLALTQFGFMGFISLGAHKIGILDESFHEATVHLWRVIGYMLGIKDEYNLCTDCWETTKPRLDLVMREIYKPALENTNKEFDDMTKALVSGLWPVNTLLDWNIAIFSTKRLAECKGYEYFNEESFGDVNIKQKIYNNMTLYKRFIISYMMFATYTLYKYNWFRIYINFRIWLSQVLAYYFPYLAIYKFGMKWAYVRIFNNQDKVHTE